MSNRKYPEVKGWWVYSIKIPSVNKYYIGVSGCKECYQRWQKSKYVGMSLEQYLDEWDSMIKTVLVDNLSSKKESLIMEDNFIRALKMNDLCLNDKRSGLIRVSDENAYNKQNWEDNKEKYNEKRRQRYKNNHEQQEKNKQRSKQWRLKKKLEHEQQQTVVD